MIHELYRGNIPLNDSFRLDINDFLKTDIYSYERAEINRLRTDKDSLIEFILYTVEANPSYKIAIYLGEHLITTKICRRSNFREIALRYKLPFEDIQKML